jgi:error-prone DNA polymerase
MPGRVVVQWDKEDCADMGIIKVDLLGLGMMAAIEECLTLIKDHYGEEVDLAHLPQDDPSIYDALCKADTIGLFQVESRAQMSCLPRLRPRKFYDIVVQVAIIRPGPIVGNMVHPYLNRRLGREEPTCLHPSLEPVLKRTLGVPLFQEQLLRIAMICSNFTGGEAEELRRAMGFKRSEARMQEIEVKLRRGMDQNGITGETQEKIVQAITSFALYGFPESHAASFALLAYASAYLKCHYLAAFTAALLNNQPMGFYHPATLIKDAQRHGLKVEPIDITRSDWQCTVEDGSWELGVGGWDGGWELGVGSWENSDWEDRKKDQVAEQNINYHQPPTPNPQPPNPAMRLGFRYVRGFREEAAKAIVRERAKRPFTDIDDLHNRVPELRKDELRKLAEVGALNFIKGQSTIRNQRAVIGNQHSAIGNQHSAIANIQSLHRRSALWQVERAAREVGPLLKEQKDENFDSPLAPMTIEERVNADFRGTGLTIGRHPMAYRREELKRLGIKSAIELQDIRNGVWVRVAGWVIVRQRPGTAKGFLFLTMEDETGVANVIVTPDIYDRNRLVLVNEPLLLIDGPLQNQDNVIHVKARRIQPLRYSMTAGASHDFH